VEQTKQSIWLDPPFLVADRLMVSTELMGSHTHETANCRSVHVWRRGDTYLARGRWNGTAFGETLGKHVKEATARLRKLIGEIEDGAYVRPSEQSRQLAATSRSTRLSLRQLINAFLVAKRAERGRQTADDYRVRLRPVLDFAERPEQLSRWPLASNIDAPFVAALKTFLMTYQTSRNGRKASPQRLLSGTQMRHALETLRGLINWATDPLIAKLPFGYVNPVGKNTIPSKPTKNPLREESISLDERVRLLERMDSWQLCQLAWSMVLPMRPDEAAGLLVTDVNVEKGWLEFGYRFDDCNFTKEKTKFVLPYPSEFRPIIAACIQGRTDGPLLQSRRAFGESAQLRDHTKDTLRQSYEHVVLEAEPGDVQAEHDRKRLFRRVLKQEWGGVSEDRMACEFKKLLHEATGRTDVRFYDLRHATTQGMKDAKLPGLELTYLTGHACTDILNEYTSLRPLEAMAQYFASIRPLIDAIAFRAAALGLTTEND